MIPSIVSALFYEHDCLDLVSSLIPDPVIGICAIFELFEKQAVIGKS